MKRKSDDTPAGPANGSELAGSKKRQRLGDSIVIRPEKEKKVKMPKNEKKEEKDKTHKKEKKGKKDRHRNREAEDVKGEAEPLDATIGEYVPMKDAEAVDATAESNPAKKERSQKKSKDKPTEAEDATAESKPAKNEKSKKKVKATQEPKDEDAAADKASADAEPTTNPNPKKKSRFIVFVGNLPYSATVEDIEKHFASVRPTSIRLLHQKLDPRKSRGIAFLEFAGYDTMKTCLKNMHHSTMTVMGRDGRGKPRTEEREINVELTAGGGGNTDARKEKIKTKNERLNEQRERRAVEEEKAKVKKEKERLTKEGTKKGDSDGVHPSRRARVPGTA